MIRKPECDDSRSGFLLVGVGCIETLFKFIDLVSPLTAQNGMFCAFAPSAIAQNSQFCEGVAGGIASHHFRQITCVMAPASPGQLEERAYHRADSMQHINKV